MANESHSVGLYFVRNPSRYTKTLHPQMIGGTVSSPGWAGAMAVQLLWQFWRIV